MNYGVHNNYIAYLYYYMHASKPMTVFQLSAINIPSMNTFLIAEVDSNHNICFL